jgi:large subunit ribosomal protein L15
MPLHRRLPKRGFSNARFKKELTEINLGRLEIFEAGTIVTPEILVGRGLIKRVRDGVKVLGEGDREDHRPGRQSRSDREGLDSNRPRGGFQGNREHPS